MLSRYSNSTDTSLQDVDSLLTYIPADDRETWISVGMALKSEFGDSAYPLFDQWSESSEKYDSRTSKHVWQSFTGSGKTMGTLVYLARKNGWSKGIPFKKVVWSDTARPKNLRQAPTIHDTSAYAKELFLAANRVDKYVMSHPYSVAKGLASAGGAGRGRASGKLIGKEADCVIVPIRHIVTDKVQGAECINAEGVKQTFGQKSGGALILGNSLQKSNPWFILEGFASAYSTVFHHNKHTAVCAFGKCSQDSVAQEINRIYNPDEIIILREVD